VLEQQFGEISLYFGSHIQFRLGMMIEEFANLTDDDGALDERQDTGLL
jgi:hypothetical protein